MTIYGELGYNFVPEFKVELKIMSCSHRLNWIISS